MKWEFKTHWGNKAAPVVAVDGTIYCGGGDGILYAFDPMGNKKWELTMQGALDASPVLAEDGTIYAVATEFAASLARWQETLVVSDEQRGDVIADDCAGRNCLFRDVIQA